MEVHVYGDPSTQIDLASESYPYHTINPGMLSKDFVPSQNMDTGFQASQTNEPTEIAQPDVHTQNNSLAGDDSPPPAKKRRGRPPGSKNKVKVDEPLNGPEQPKPQRKARVPKKQAKSSPQSAPDEGAGLNLQQGFDPIGQSHFGIPPQAGAATAIPMEGATPNHLPTPHRKGCLCGGCDIVQRPEDKTTRSGAPFNLFASIIGEAAAAVYTHNEDISYQMGDYASLPPTQFKDKQQERLKESIDNVPLIDRQGNLVTSIPSRSTIKEHALRMMKQKMQELKRRNKTFTSEPPCIRNGTFDVQHYITYDLEEGRNVVDDPM